MSAVAAALPFRRIVVIGASADGVVALKRIAHDLPSDFPAPVLIVLHIGRHSQMPTILARTSHLPALHPVDGEHIYPGRIYVAPSDRNIRIERDHIRVSASSEDHYRPSIDALTFRTGSAQDLRAP